MASRKAKKLSIDEFHRELFLANGAAAIRPSRLLSRSGYLLTLTQPMRSATNTYELPPQADGVVHLPLVFQQCGAGVLVYESDFDNAVGLEWSQQELALAPQNQHAGLT